MWVGEQGRGVDQGGVEGGGETDNNTLYDLIKDRFKKENRKQKNTLSGKKKKPVM